MTCDNPYYDCTDCGGSSGGSGTNVNVTSGQMINGGVDLELTLTDGSKLTVTDVNPSLAISGEYLGSSATFAGLPTPSNASNGDFAILTDDDGTHEKGIYLYNGTSFSFVSGLGTSFSLLTTKGDIIGHNGTEPVKVPVGADNRCLTSDSSEPSGLAWVKYSHKKLENITSGNVDIDSLEDTVSYIKGYGGDCAFSHYPMAINPTGGTIVQVTFQSESSTGNAVQYLHELNGDRIFVRTRQGNAWKGWKEVGNSNFVAKVSSTDNRLTRFDGTGGEIQNSTIELSDYREMKFLNSDNSTNISWGYADRRFFKLKMNSCEYFNFMDKNNNSVVSIADTGFISIKRVTNGGQSNNCLSIMSNDLANNSNMSFRLGKEQTSRNSGIMQYIHAGNGSHSNELWLGFQNIKNISMYSSGYTEMKGQLGIMGIYKFPKVDGSNKQVMQTNGSGVLSWVDMAGNHSHRSVTNGLLNSDFNMTEDDFHKVPFVENTSTNRLVNGIYTVPCNGVLEVQFSATWEATIDYNDMIEVVVEINGVNRLVANFTGFAPAVSGSSPLNGKVKVHSNDSVQLKLAHHNTNSNKKIYKGSNSESSYISFHMVELY